MMKNGTAIEWFAWRLFVLAGCAVIAIKLTSISTAPTPDLEGAFVHLVTEQELALAKAKLLDEIQAPSPSCKRPVLRGAAAPGTSENDVLAFERAPLGRCVEQWKAVLSHTQLTPEKAKVIESCGATIEAAVRAAIAHEDACSPYNIRGPDETSGTMLFVAQLLGERARVVADAGDVDGALWQLLEVIRWGQDRARGRTDLLAMMLATAATSSAVEHANAILDKASPTQLDELTAAVDALLASEPSFGEAAASDGLRVGLDYGITPLEPASWTPPGGARKQPAPPAIGEAARGYAIETLIFGTTSSPKAAQACPVTASLAACRRGFAQPVTPISSDGTLRSTLVQALIETMTGPWLALWPEYIAKRAADHGALIALRLRLEVLKHGCADRATLAKLATTPHLGDAMRLTDDAGPTLLVSPPSWVQTREPPHRIQCRH